VFLEGAPGPFSASRGLAAKELNKLYTTVGQLARTKVGELLALGK